MRNLHTIKPNIPAEIIQIVNSFNKDGSYKLRYFIKGNKLYYKAIKYDLWKLFPPGHYRYWKKSINNVTIEHPDKFEILGNNEELT